MSDKWMPEFEAAMIASFSGGDTAYEVGYYSYAAARAATPDSIEFTWYPDVFTRFHQLQFVLPRDAFVACVGSEQYDYKPIIFVRDAWIAEIHDRSHSVFALFDAIGVKTALTSGAIARRNLISLREEIDHLAAKNPLVAFISFGDSLLLKSNFSVGRFDNPSTMKYEPEKILLLIPEIRKAYKATLGLEIYAVVTQGSNEYFDDGLLHTSPSGYHISLNSLGLPFAQIQKIEAAARAAIRSFEHDPADAYLDDAFYNSLRFIDGFEKRSYAKHPYIAPMSARPSFYVAIGFEALAANLAP